MLQQGFGRSAEQNRGLGGDIRLKKSSPYPLLFLLLHGGRPRLEPTEDNSVEYIATREISTSLGPKSAVFTMCYANAHPEIGQSTCTELAWGPWVDYILYTILLSCTYSVVVVFRLKTVLTSI